jgi:RNA polymerase sigma-70 factor (ECF subfamily)
VPQKDIDLALVIRVQAGDYQAFDLLVKKYQHRLLALAQRFVGDPDEAMDVVQDSFIKVYKALGRFRGESAFYTWIYRITVNTAKNFLSSRQRRPQSVDLDLEELESSPSGYALHEVATPEAEAYRDQLEDIVMKAIDGLSQDLRTALVLREFEGLSYDDIAVIMECPIGTVRSRIFRARDAVDARIKSASGEEITETVSG